MHHVLDISSVGCLNHVTSVTIRSNIHKSCKEIQSVSISNLASNLNLLDDTLLKLSLRSP